MINENELKTQDNESGLKYIFENILWALQINKVRILISDDLSEENESQCPVFCVTPVYSI